MKVEILKVKGSWREIADRCNTTVGKEDGTAEPSDKWKKKLLLAEHSPIRTMVFTIKLSDIPYYVSVHLVRHKLGVEHFVRSQRSDRTGVARESLPQNMPVIHIMEANIQALIFMSRKRLCGKADPMTRQVWETVVQAIKAEDPIIGSILVPECVYRGFCPEGGCTCNKDPYIEKYHQV